MSAGKSARLSIREIAELSLFCALMVAGKECLRLIPNVHPVTLLLLATAVYGAKALYPAFGFALLEIALYGAGLWNLMYLYVWPIVVLAALPFRRSESRAFWAAIAGPHCAPFRIFSSAEGRGRFRGGFRASRMTSSTACQIRSSSSCSSRRCGAHWSARRKRQAEENSKKHLPSRQVLFVWSCRFSAYKCQNSVSSSSENSRSLTAKRSMPCSSP